MFSRLLRLLILLPALFYTAGFLLSQKQAMTYAQLLMRYEQAMALYNKATDVGAGAHYGGAQEAIEKKLNAGALRGFTTLLTQFEKGPPGTDSLYFQTAYKMAELHHYFEERQEALHYYRLALHRSSVASLPDSLQFKPLLFSGLIYYQQNKFDSALQLLTLAETLQQKHQQLLAEGERLYNLLGVLLYEQGDYKLAQNYFSKAASVLPKSNPYYRELYVNYRINQAQIFLRIEEYDKAHKIYMELLPLGLYPDEINHNIGSLNLALGASGKALSYFSKIRYNNSKRVRLYNSMGNAFLYQGRYDSALHFYQQALTVHQSGGNNSDPVGYGLTLKSMGDLASEKGDEWKALSFYQQSLLYFYPGFTDTALKSNPTSFTGVFSYINLFAALNAKAGALHRLYASSNQTALGDDALAAYQSAFLLTSYVAQTYTSDEALLFLSKIKYAAHHPPIELAYKMYRQTGAHQYLEALYKFDQLNKASALALSQQNLNQHPVVKKGDFEEETELKKRITRISLKSMAATDSTSLSKMEQQVRDLEIKLSKLRSGRSGLAGSETNIPSLALVQSNLPDKKTALISYHLSLDKLTKLLVTKEKTTVTQQDLPTDFATSFEAFITGLKNAENREQKSLAQNLYRLLFNGIPMQQLDQLILIPDDQLFYLPFEALVDGNGKYVAEHCALTYQYATSFLHQQEITLEGANSISMAPFASTGFGGLLNRLPQSATETAPLIGKKLADTAATKTAFLTQAPRHKIIHLATHAFPASVTSPAAIAFSPAETDHYLYEAEIYAMDLHHTELVVLSACETGAGSLAKGEGVMSLSRAFRYAGCNNLVTSLWKADDFSTAYITRRFYQHLQQEGGAGRALQLAKLDYLEDKKINPRLKHPYYWAHLVYAGSVPKKSGAVWYWMVGGTILLLLFAGLLRAWISKRTI